MSPAKEQKDGGSDSEEKGVSTAASGPAGAHFEQEVAAFYLLAMLCGAPPRGMPGARIDKVKLQQANAGHPLDDVILGLTDAAGQAASLEIQAKRTVTFSPSDKVFAKVVDQVFKTSQDERFTSSTVEMAVATSRGSRKIDGAYQDVLATARQLDSGLALASHLAMPGVANQDMRDFVATFKAGLSAAGAPADDDTVWRLLRRLQILVFDFEAPGSISRDLSRERCRSALAPEHVGMADALWTGLTDIAFETAKRGGSHDRQSLQEALKPLGLSLASERRHVEARRALAEAARLALTDIKIQVGDVQLARRDWVGQVRAALDEGRYVEIRGESGVGKSGVLRQLSELMQREGQVIVLSPSRCPSKGGAEFCARIGYQGSARELLADLAADGGATLFVDNLDFYDAAARATVVDLLREAATISAISVVATARPGFGVDDADWLPADAIATLKRAKPVVISDLSDGERAELCAKAPALAPLLAPNHPARQVSGNLFRLGRLVRRPADAQQVRTEVELADLWWSLADGVKDAGLRDRGRLLAAMGLHALSDQGAFDSSGHPAVAVDQLKESGTLRELARDRVDFQHDVLREWAVAFTLYADPKLVDALPLAKPATAALARGIELAARLSLERTQDDAKWVALLQQVSRPGAHRTWRRYVLLAVTRSEAADLLLPRARKALLSSDAVLLKELASTVATIEVTTLAELLAGYGVDLTKLPSSMRVPNGRCWPSFIEWLLTLGPALPANAVHEVLRLFQVYAFGTIGESALVTDITKQVGTWLRYFEPRTDDYRPTPPPPGVNWQALDHDQFRPLKRELHEFFVVFARRVPDLAKAYVQAAVDNFSRNGGLTEQLVLTPYSLAEAAPAELADLTAMVLIEAPDPEEDEDLTAPGKHEAFTFVDNSFLPVSPTQGPFFGLLTHAPAVGLHLVHRLVAHAVAWRTDGKEPSGDAIVLTLNGQPRAFPWTGTYAWSRQSNYYAMSSALQALEAWAHRRLEAKEPFDVVLADVLGPPGSCAAFLLVAVDLLLSHRAVSLDSALPFLACPELLSLDLEREHLDQVAPSDPFGVSQMFGLGETGREPGGLVSTADLRKRASRRAGLATLINALVNHESTRLQELTESLQAAAQRLGPPESRHTLRNPEFMVRHALNRANPVNWAAVQLQHEDGRVIPGRQYVAPAEEHAHLEALRAKVASSNEELHMTLRLHQVLNKPGEMGADELRAAIEWAQAPERDPCGAIATGGTGAGGATSIDRNAVFTVPLLVMRDAAPTIRERHADWALACFDAALRDPQADHVLQLRKGLTYNPLATCFAGRLLGLRYRRTLDDMRAVLTPAARGSHEVAHGLGAALSAVLAADGRLLKALVRCALQACIRPRRPWSGKPDQEAADAAERDAAQIVDAELRWLSDAGAEPDWPVPPRKEPVVRAGLRIPGAPAAGDIESTGAPATEDVPDAADPDIVDDEEFVEPPMFHHRSAALWLRQIGSGQASQLPWLADLVQAFLPWTMTANGADLPLGARASDAPREWNEAFLGLFAEVLPEDDLGRALALIEPMWRLEDQSFFDLVGVITAALDASYFSAAHRPSTAVAVGLRDAMADHLIKTWGWRRAQGEKDGFTETHLGAAIAGMFFNGRSDLQASRCYLQPLGIDRLGPFLPTLQKLVAAGPHRKVAEVVLNLIEVSPHAEHLPLLALACRTWLATFGDYRVFWVDFGFGSRWCKAVGAAIANPKAQLDAALTAELGHVAAELVALGVQEAPGLEAALTS